jgi:hypothetical protein
MWKIARSSVIGKSHLDNNTPIQDFSNYIKIGETEEILIGSISDGLGSCKYSEIGSKIAVNTSINKLREEDWSRSYNKDKIKAIFVQMVEDVQQKLEDEAIHKKCNKDELGCTLIAFVATPSWTAAMQIGDGLIVCRYSNSEDYTLVLEPYRGKYQSTMPVTESKALSTMKVFFSEDLIRFICIATDGIENLSIDKEKGWKPSPGFFKTLESRLRECNTDEIEEELYRIFSSTDTDKKSKDDKTLIACHRDYPESGISYSNELTDSNERSKLIFPELPFPQINQPDTKDSTHSKLGQKSSVIQIDNKDLTENKIEESSSIEISSKSQNNESHEKGTNQIYTKFPRRLLNKLFPRKSRVKKDRNVEQSRISTKEFSSSPKAIQTKHRFLHKSLLRVSSLLLLMGLSTFVGNQILPIASIFKNYNAVKNTSENIYVPVIYAIRVSDVLSDSYLSVLVSNDDISTEDKTFKIKEKKIASLKINSNIPVKVSSSKPIDIELPPGRYHYEASESSPGYEHRLKIKIILPASPF